MAKQVLVVGDVIVDEYVYVETRRQAAEAQIPVWDEVRRESRPGGAWNVAKNIQAMDPTLEVYLAGILGVQRWGGPMESTLCFGGEEIVKRRYVHNGKIIFRHDDRRRFDETDIELFKEKLYSVTDYGRRMDFEAVVFSDYDKGTLDDIISFCGDLSELVIVDSKRRDLKPFCRSRGDWTTILKVNEEEWGMHAADECSPEALFDHVVVTKGKDGAVLRQYDLSESSLNRSVIHEEHFPTRRVWPVDVTGCGDTHTAAMTVALLREGSVRGAVRFANEKASQAVQEFGTAVVK